MPEVNVGVDAARPKVSEAGTLFRRLVLQPSAARRRLLEDQTFDDPELCRLLLEEVSDRVFHDPADALDLAGLACEVAKRLGDATWIFLARLDLANALRIRGELKLSEEEIRQVEPMLARLPRQPLFEGRVCQVKASLATDRHQFARALELAERALGLFRSAGEPRWICEALVGKGHILAQAERPSDALRALREALPLLAPETHPRLFVICLHNLVTGLNALGYSIAASSLLSDLKQLHEKLGDSLNLLRFRWLEGRILRDLGQLGKAEQAFAEAQEGFLDHDLPYNAAIVALDLAEVYLQQSRSYKLRQLVMGMFPIFQSRSIHREALAALILFRESVALHTADLKLVRRLADFLDQAKNNPRLRFQPPG